MAFSLTGGGFILGMTMSFNKTGFSQNILGLLRKASGFSNLIIMPYIARGHTHTHTHTHTEAGIRQKKVMVNHGKEGRVRSTRAN